MGYRTAQVFSRIESGYGITQDNERPSDQKGEVGRRTEHRKGYGYKVTMVLIPRCPRKLDSMVENLGRTIWVALVLPRGSRSPMIRRLVLTDAKLRSSDVRYKVVGTTVPLPQFETVVRALPSI